MWLAQGFIVTMIWGWYFSKEYMIILEFFLISYNSCVIFQEIEHLI